MSGGLRLTSGIFLSHSPTYSLKQGLVGEPRICQFDRLVRLAYLHQESSLLSQCWNYRHVINHTWHLDRFWGPEL